MSEGPHLTREESLDLGSDCSGQGERSPQECFPLCAAQFDDNAAEPQFRVQP